MSSESLPWPDGCWGAVSLTFDDGHPSQLKKAVPILENVGLQGTFYLNPSDFSELVAHLDRHRQRIWTAPVTIVAQRIIEWQKEISRV